MIEFAASTLSGHPAGGGRPPSTAEVYRIERTFLRFELYSNPFRMRSDSDDPFSSEEQLEIFFKKFPP